MLNSAALLLAAAAQISPDGTVHIYGRDFVTVAESRETFSGRCDGRRVSATIQKAFRGAKGSLTLTAGDLARSVPESFLEGRHFASSFMAAGIGCDGRRMMFRARVAHLSDDGAVVVQAQSVSMDLESGELSASEIRNLPPEEAATGQ